METSDENNIVTSRVVILRFLAVNVLSGGFYRMTTSVVDIGIMLLEMESQ